MSRFMYVFEPGDTFATTGGGDFGEKEVVSVWKVAELGGLELVNDDTRSPNYIYMNPRGS